MDNDLKPVNKSQVSQTPKETAPSPTPAVPEVSPEEEKAKKRRKFELWLLIVFILLTALTAAFWYFRVRSKPVTSQPQQATTTPQPTVAKSSNLTLDPNKNYGNKYANGLLPVGDNKYQATGAKKGSVYVCSGYANNLQAGGGGAGSRGPWFTNNNTQYDINKKAKVSGNVSWKGNITNTVAGDTRTITSNDLPVDHTTGVFPIDRTDAAAYAYDKNPNSIKSKNNTYALSANPTYGDPQCLGGQVGVMLTGVALFNGFDAAGRDAGAWEVQDDCSGHPEKTGEYHYHTLSGCIKDVSVNTVIGYALDGFPITGPKVGDNNFLTTDDLDECHGITSQVTIDGKKVTTYHYVMTQDFPYSASCFRAKAINPPGQPARGAQP